MRRELLCGAAALAITTAISGPVMAADAPAYKGPVAAAALFNWTGFYVGGHIGAGDARMNFGHPATEPDQPFADASVIAGGHLGYNWQMNNLVLGVEGDLTWARMKPIATCCSNRSTTVDLLGSLRARLGVVVDQRVLFYATGGIGWAWGKNYTSLDNVNIGSTTSYTATGPVLGAGVEWAVTRSVLIRAETLYYIFNHQSADFNGELVKIENVWTARVGASVRF